MNQNKEKDIQDCVKRFYGVVDTPYLGATYILRDGYLLDLHKCKHHSEVEQLLINSGLSDSRYVATGGSQTMREIGAVRCDTQKYYIELPEKNLTDAQYNTLLVWLDFLASVCRIVTVYTDCGENSVTYSFSEVIPDDIVRQIHRYYTFGVLYENRKKFARKPIGSNTIDTE